MNKREASSFRDPAGIVFHHNDEIYRQINLIYKNDYDFFLSSGLYDTLAKKRKILPFQETASPVFDQENCYKIIKPLKIDFISYPYEWSFSQLKDAALLTLNLQKEALLANMTLKDASGYNIQFWEGHPVLIDTLSFARYTEGAPWIAYRQFCQHFLAPIALMGLTDIRLNSLLQIYIDGIPLDLASRLLPRSSWLNPGLLTHIHLHAKAQKKYSADKAANPDRKPISKTALVGLIENLEKTVRRIQWKQDKTTWAEYYGDTNYTDQAFQHKKSVVRELLSELNPGILLDVGANTGVFSRQALHLKDCVIISSDIDPGAVEQNYLKVKQDRETNLVPVLVNLANPSPAAGWQNQERAPFLQRAHADTIMALALIHHLAITNNVPLKNISDLFARLGEHLIIEFIPKEDSQVQRLLASREDIFPEYTLQGFKDAFSSNFTLRKEIPINESKRTIFLMRRKRTSLA